ncbi:MAG: O-antigen ligase family protein [Saccharofermentans sp.]|jgi:hypothetical protein|nr:O-antigen ligase family protein [Saccharofermentans sp.]
MSDGAKTKTPVLAKITSDKVFCYLSMVLLVFLPVAEIIQELLKATKNKVFRFMYPSYYQPYIVAVFGIALTALVILSFISRAVSGKFKFCIADVFYFTLLAFMLISMFCSVNFGVFASGLRYYMEHPLHFLCYYGMFYAGSMIEDSDLRKKLVFTYIIVAVIEGVVGFLQTRGIQINYCLYLFDMPSDNAAYGTLQNTNFFGSLSCLLTAASSGFFIFSSKLTKSKALKWGSLAVALVSFYTLIASAARMAWIGMTAMILTYIISLIVMRKGAIDKDSLRQITIDFLTLIIGYIAVIIITIIFDDYISDRVEQTMDDSQVTTNVAAGEEDLGDLGNGRGKIWRAALMSVPHHWLTGIGLDNLAQAFREMPGWQQGDYIQDKGHSEFIHTLATQGVFAFINYVALIIYATVNSVKAIMKEKDDVKRSLLWLFFGMFAAYLTQSLASSSIMNVAPYFWLVLGILTPRTKPISLKKK